MTAFRPTLKRAAAVTAFAFAGLFAPTSSAGPATREIQRYDVPVENSSIDAGAARVAVIAPPEMLRSVVTDYGRYASIVPKFQTARVVGRAGKSTDVYLEVPILKGAAKVWAIVRFEPPRAEGSQELVRGRLIKGNVKRLDATWRIRKVDERFTELNLELLIVPDLPAPSSVIERELRMAAGKAVHGVRLEAERRHRR